MCHYTALNDSDDTVMKHCPAVPQLDTVDCPTALMLLGLETFS